MGYFPGAEIPPPQINFRLNDRIEFDRPGKYKISVTCRTEFRKPQEVLDDPYGDRKSAVDITLVTEAVEVDVLPEAANVASFASDAIILLQSHFRDDDPWSFSPDSTPFPEWTQYSHKALPGNAPLTEAEVDARYSDLGALMRKLKLKIVNVLPYDEYGRCKDARSDGEKRSF